MYKPMTFKQSFHLYLVALLAVSLLAAMSWKLASFVVSTCALAWVSILFTAQALMLFERHGRWGLSGIVPSVAVGLSCTIGISLLLQQMFSFANLGAPGFIASVVGIVFGAAWGMSTRNEDWVLDSAEQNTLC
ncbi:MAG: hypothetical protein K2X81_07970 [Candidatus Obscuribacterales bacterium]|nr:hypothetical protein [Candidatus Obscuribacterales bacterium]